MFVCFRDRALSIHNRGPQVLVVIGTTGRITRGRSSLLPHVPLFSILEQRQHPILQPAPSLPEIDHLCRSLAPFLCHLPCTVRRICPIYHLHEASSFIKCTLRSYSMASRERSAASVSSSASNRALRSDPSDSFGPDHDDRRYRILLLEIEAEPEHDPGEVWTEYSACERDQRRFTQVNPVVR